MILLTPMKWKAVESLRSVHTDLREGDRYLHPVQATLEQIRRGVVAPVMYTAAGAVDLARAGVDALRSKNS